MASAQGIQIQFKCLIPEDYFYQVDKQRVQQILINLISNSLKFSPRNSQITIQVEAWQQADGYADVHISVIDEGQGIDESQQCRLFSASNFEPGSRSG